MLSAAFTNKVRLRSDGSDGARVYVHLRDPQNFPIYQFHDFELKLRILTGKVSVEGPFSSLTGPYFLVKGSEVGKVKMEAWIDGESFGQPVELEFVGRTGRVPASDTNECVKSLALFLGRDTIPKANVLEEYERLSEVMIDSFQMLITPSELQLEKNLQALSSVSCTSIAQLDHLRESFSTRLRQIALKAHRTAQSKGNIHNMWNPHRTPQN